MTARETWYKRDPITQQLILDGMGDPIPVEGNVLVDFVWGNYAMQPNDDRIDGESVVVGPNVAQNRQWSGWSVWYSNTLQTTDYDVSIGNIYGVNTYPTPADNHINNTIGWDAFPAYTPEAGITEGGSDNMPNFVGLTVEAAANLALATGFRVTSVVTTKSGTHAPGFVYAQNRNAGDSFSHGTTIQLSVYEPLDGANPGVTYDTAIAPWVNGTVAG